MHLNALSSLVFLNRCLQEIQELMREWEFYPDVKFSYDCPSLIQILLIKSQLSYIAYE